MSTEKNNKSKNTKTKSVKSTEVKSTKVSEIKSVKKTKSNTIELKIPTESFYGTGRRKSSVAKTWLFEGKGRFTINGKNIKDYVNTSILESKIIFPLKVLGLEKKYDIVIKTLGGGIVGQTEASQLGVARALIELNEEFRKPLKSQGLLKRDSRVKERKKYGRKKARKGYQFRKR
ncbi:30S ribosomal protein S9 [Candidatus Marinamargulisbacteria bacterium SCGC AG-410-N11]|nr:30S ribosomal protein S9 [Candidatus Marinamargulisbacteria bacterium SCGC AG-410-N11]